MKAKHMAVRILILLMMLLAPRSLSAGDMSGLLGLVTSQLGVSESQASGGMEALLGSAKEKMGGGDYSRLLSMAPGLKGLASSGGDDSGGGGSSWSSYAGMASAMLGGGSSATQMQQLAEKFDRLGLGPEKVMEYAKIAYSYVQDEGGSEALDLLKSGLSL